MEITHFTHTLIISNCEYENNTFYTIRLLSNNEDWDSTPSLGHLIFGIQSLKSKYDSDKVKEIMILRNCFDLLVLIDFIIDKYIILKSIYIYIIIYYYRS